MKILKYGTDPFFKIQLGASMKGCLQLLIRSCLLYVLICTVLGESNAQCNLANARSGLSRRSPLALITVPADSSTNFVPPEVSSSITVLNVKTVYEIDSLSQSFSYAEGTGTGWSLCGNSVTIGSGSIGPSLSASLSWFIGIGVSSSSPFTYAGQSTMPEYFTRWQMFPEYVENEVDISGYKTTYNVFGRASRNPYSLNFTTVHSGQLVKDWECCHPDDTPTN
jgi:hypothetical protein